MYTQLYCSILSHSKLNNIWYIMRDRKEVGVYVSKNPAAPTMRVSGIVWVFYYVPARSKNQIWGTYTPLIVDITQTSGLETQGFDLLGLEYCHFTVNIKVKHLI